MESYKERYLKEIQELEHRIARLSLLLHRYELGVLGFELNCPVQLLQSQLEIMLKYADILDRRYKYEFPTEKEQTKESE